MTIAFTIIGIDLCISKNLLISAVFQTPLNSNMKSFYCNHRTSTLTQKTAGHLKENKIRASVNAIISWIGFWLIVSSGACGVHERESQKRICRLMVRSVFWIMFNLGIQDTMTVIIKDWKCEWNWNASQEKQNLYIPTKLWLISLKDWEIIAFQRLKHIYIKCKSNSALSCVIGERHCSPKCCWKHGVHP